MDTKEPNYKRIFGIILVILSAILGLLTYGFYFTIGLIFWLMDVNSGYFDFFIGFIVISLPFAIMLIVGIILLKKSEENPKKISKKK